jgi:hypothetical protein
VALGPYSWLQGETDPATLIGRHSRHNRAVSIRDQGLRLLILNQDTGNRVGGIGEVLSGTSLPRVFAWKVVRGTAISLTGFGTSDEDFDLERGVQSALERHFEIEPLSSEMVEWGLQ